MGINVPKNYNKTIDISYINEENVESQFSSFGNKVFKYDKQIEKYAADLINDIYKEKEKQVERPTPKIKEKTKISKKVKTMNQFLTLDIGSNKATIDLSKVRKQGLIFEKTMFGRKPKIVIYYQDRPETPEVNFELNSEEEAQSVYSDIQNRLNRWAEESNSARLQVLEKELEVMHEQKDALLEEKQVLMDVFNQFKEMMQIMEDDTKTSTLVDTIKAM